MRYTDEQIRETLLTWVKETEQTEVVYVIPFCLGYYGYISNQIWRVICELRGDGVLN